MTVSWRGLHLLVGTLGLALFVLTGQYMQHMANVPAMDDSLRLMYRSLHLYLLGACAGNVLVAVYMTPGRPLGWLRGTASAGLLLCAPLMALSFFTEAAPGAMDRPLASVSMYLLFGAPVVLLLAEARDRFSAG